MPRPTLTDKIRDALAAELGTPVFPLGAKLPSEQELAAQFQVSRTTIREAVSGLAEAGLVSRVHGAGTYVTTSRAHHSLGATLSYTSMIQAAGFVADTVLLGMELRPADDHERAELRLLPQAPVLAVERVRTADGRAAIYSRDRVPAHLLGPDLLQRPSLYQALERVGVHVRSASARLTPVAAAPELARILHMAPGAPLLHIEQTDLDQTGRPVVVSTEWHVPGVLELRINRRAHS